MTSAFKTLRNDLPASVVVFLVALPLCLGIALASGAPLFSGLISGIVGGIVVGSLSKARLSVSGPAAGLVVIVLNAVDSLGAYEAFLVAVFISGVLQVLLSILKAGIIGMYFPSSVIKGMLAAIGLILILKQIPHLVGFDSDAFGEMEFIQSDGSNTLTALFHAFTQLHYGSLIVGMIALVLLILWERPLIKSHSVLSQIPGGVLAVLVAVGVNELFAFLVPDWRINESHLVSIPIIEGFDSLKSIIITPDWTVLSNPQVYITGVTLAIVASLETLLSIEAIDKLDPGKHRTPQNAELRAQGVGNMFCGFLGGLPITAVIVRGSANVAAGAKSKMSAVMHGILLLTAVAFFPYLVNQIPLAALAAILVVVGFKLTKPTLYVHQYKVGKEQFVPFISTVVSILFTDLLIGILIGMAIGVFFILRANYQVAYHYDQIPGSDGKKHIQLRLSEHVSFLNKASLQLTLEGLPEDCEVTIDASQTKAIHHDALELIYNFRKTAEEKNIDLQLKMIPELKMNGFGT